MKIVIVHIQIKNVELQESTNLALVIYSTFMRQEVFQLLLVFLN
jgi:hypothetical protein